MIYDRVLTAEEIEAIQNLEWEWFPCDDEPSSDE